MYNIRPMPMPVTGPRPGIATPFAPAAPSQNFGTGGFGGGIAASLAPQMANPGAAARSFAPMGPTMGNHFVEQN